MNIISSLNKIGNAIDSFTEEEKELFSKNAAQLFSKTQELKNIQKVYNALSDEESKIIYEARLQYMFDLNKSFFLKSILSLNKRYVSSELDKLFSKRSGDTRIILFSAGFEGKHIYEVIKMSKYKDNIFAFCDNDLTLWGTSCCGLPVLAPNDLYEYQDAIILICNEKYRFEIYSQLLRMLAFPIENVYIPRLNTMNFVVENTQEYFDAFAPREQEIFIDGGAYNGRTAVDFSKWCKGSYERIYSFEPNKQQLDICKKTFERAKLENIAFSPKGTWSKDATLTFTEKSFSSKIDEHGKSIISVTSIDNVLQGKRASFIKLDVEGAELESLIGAKNTIQKWRPRLAICIYHKPEDIVEIPAYLLEIMPDYKLTIRHYSSRMMDTILYAE